MFVIKAGGGKEYFNLKKLEKSLLAIGLEKKFARALAEEVSLRYKKSVTTEEIRRYLMTRLKDYGPHVFGKYNLKKAIMNLGPTGFTFEKYVARILDEYGYKTKTNQIVSGHCVKHEVDVMAWKDKTHFIVECKYHNQPGSRSDLKVALYVWARFLDLKRKWEEDLEHNQREFHGIWLVTNTRCTTDAIQYGECVGMLITGWGYPKEMSLEKMINDKKLYPINLFPDWSSRFEYQRFYEKGIFLLKDCLSYSAKDLSRKTGYKEEDLLAFQADARKICF